jgi:hypothetical protein
MGRFLLAAVSMSPIICRYRTPNATPHPTLQTPLSATVFPDFFYQDLRSLRFGRKSGSSILHRLAVRSDSSIHAHSSGDSTDARPETFP